MHSKHLPLPSQTQFVESIVKEAKSVSTTDCSEEHRTWMAIIRSATPLGKTEKDWNTNKIKATMQSARDWVNPLEQWKERDADQHAARFQRAQAGLSEEHYKQIRTQDKLNRIDTKASKFKKQNVIQQTKQQHQTPTVSGLIPLGKLFTTKEGHMEGLEIELVHRGVPVEDIQKWKINARKDKLRMLEAERLIQEEGLELSKASELAKKHFRVLSSAAFNLVD